MAIDFKKLDIKQTGVIVLALVAGLVAVVLTNGYINTAVSKGASSEELNALFEKIKNLEQENQALYQRQDAYANQMQQQLEGLSQAQKTRQAPQQDQKESVRVQSLALQTPSGKRAVTVKIETLLAAGGLINPGDFVDVIVHLKIPRDRENLEILEKTTVTLFQNVQVLAIAANVEDPSNFVMQQKMPTLPITLAVDPDQAEMLMFAEGQGKLQLVLRGPSEKREYKLSTGNWESFNKYLLETQGVIIDTFKGKKDKRDEEDEEDDIQIFRKGTN